MLPSALQYLADDLVFGHARGDGVQGRASLASDAVEHVAVATLLVLKNQRALAFQRSSMVEDTLAEWARASTHP